ncbi:DNA polymerase IV [Tsukamurella tyrosinosolvens]|uniref:DNA polymerase IV n=2 Tax=Tsukamurella tyrosinosolvens TaxID=57704 RepID=A0A1H4XG96_TSUTY|nr:DNA polymerase IV [Tsukamurella tyrosinosolvens]KXP04404.1 DNA polymerase IV [Tsukamurella tyrosinosolvens]KZL97643.1 DNA polymerase IV [Tsukamurella tyrosinosolvens]MCA4995752.1 DNA polymerase IV [Tsukamurella tyrosinosolvens]RDB47312.1 DNA polymerase IV [Tsukamurella tyrosinosolvens]
MAEADRVGSVDAERSARWVLHFDMDAFFASCEQLTRPTLRGRPVLVGGLGGRGVVAGCSYEARVFGARSAMPMHQARRLVGAAAVVLPPRGALYGTVSRRVFATVRELIPVVETLSFDEAFGEPVELAGASTDEVTAFAEELRRRIREETGLVASVGAGAGKQAAKIASGLAKPDGVSVIPPAAQEAMLYPLPVRKLWGIGPVAGERLSRLGIDTIGQFAAMSEVEVVSVLGVTLGPALHRLARGEDDRPVAVNGEAKSISAEHTLETDVTTMNALRREIDRSAEHALRRLRRDGRGARTVVLKLKRSDMSLLTRSATLPSATTDGAVLTATAQRLALDPMEIGGLRLVGVGFSGLSSVEQFALFGDESDRNDEASGAADEVADDDGGVDPAEVQIPVVGWRPGMDVRHPEFGHGWVQGAGHGVLSVRFETRSSGAGRMRSFKADDPDLREADPLDSLDWPAEHLRVDEDDED